MIAPVGLVKRECADKVAQQPQVLAPDHPDADTRTPPARSLPHNILCQELSPHMEGLTAETIRLSFKGKPNPQAHLLTCITPSTPLNILPRRPSPGVGGAANARGPGGRSRRRVRTAEPGHVPAVQPGHMQLPARRDSPCDDRGCCSRACRCQALARGLLYRRQRVSARTEDCLVTRGDSPIRIGFPFRATTPVCRRGKQPTWLWARGRREVGALTAEMSWQAWHTCNYTRRVCATLNPTRCRLRERE